MTGTNRGRTSPLIIVLLFTWAVAGAANASAFIMGGAPSTAGVLATLIAACSWLVAACLAGSRSNTSFIRFAAIFWASVVVGAPVAFWALNAAPGMSATQGGWVLPLLLLILTAPLYGLSALLPPWAPLAQFAVVGLGTLAFTLITYLVSQRIATQRLAKARTADERARGNLIGEGARDSVKQRIACVGDSITRGTFVWRRKRNAYPAQLQAMLGEQYVVYNFGVNGHAVQESADRPYRTSEAFRSSGDSEPDIVLIMLGTNDSRGDNWKGPEAFRAGYFALAEHYLSLDSKPTVWLLTPPTLYCVGRSNTVRYGMNDRAIQEVCLAIRDVARDLGCGVIDVNGATAHHPEGFRFDGVHPGSAGATLIAKAVADVLLGDESQ